MLIIIVCRNMDWYRFEDMKPDPVITILLQNQNKSAPGHLAQGGHPHQVVQLQPLDEDPDEADEGELHEGEEDHGEAEHHVPGHEGCIVTVMSA